MSNRELVNWFLQLPFRKQWELAVRLDLAQMVDSRLPSEEWEKRIFALAREGGKLDAMREMASK
jgi:hypothetical protein